MRKLFIIFLLIFCTVSSYAQTDSLQNIDANRFLVVVEGKVGYIDSLGKVAIAPVFAMGSQFNEGIASVTHQTKKGFRFAFIDKDMNVVVPVMFDAAGDFSEGLARVQVDNKWGYINKKGNTAIEPQFSLCYEFTNGYAQASKKGKWGIINKKGEWAVIPQYQSITQVQEGVFAAQKTYSSAWKFINLKGKQVLKDSFSRAGYFNKGLAPVRNSDNKWGYINKKGQVIIPYQFNGALAFSDNGLASVKKNGYWGFINTKGEVVLEYKYINSARFRHNYALVEGKTPKESLFGNIKIKFLLSVKDEDRCKIKPSLSCQYV